MSQGVFIATCYIFASCCCVFLSILTSWGHIAERIECISCLEKKSGGNQRRPATMFGLVDSSDILSRSTDFVDLTRKLISGWASWHLHSSHPSGTPTATLSLKRKHDFIYMGWFIISSVRKWGKIGSAPGLHLRLNRAVYCQTDALMGRLKTDFPMVASVEVWDVSAVCYDICFRRCF